MPHKFQYTLDLLRSVIHQMPAAFPQDRHAEMDAKLNELEANTSATQEEIEATIITFGKEIWPYMEAYEQFYRGYGEAREREAMRAKLSEPARAAFDKFVNDGGKVEDVRGGAKFEELLAPDIRAEVVRAELDSHDAVHEEIEKIIADQSAGEFAGYVEEHRKKLAAIEQKIGELRALSTRMEKWAPEILDKAKTFELGFGYVERAPTLEDVTREFQYYVDIMGLV